MKRLQQIKCLKDPTDGELRIFRGMYIFYRFVEPHN